MKLEKITTKARRTYADACGATHAMELLGERWALLVVRELMLGPKRFSELKADLPGISANVLTQRLEGLEASGVLMRRRLAPPASVQVYELTSWGYEAEPIFQTLGRWAARSPCHDPTLPLSAVSMMMSLRTMIDRQAAEALDLTAAFVFGDERFEGRLVGGDLTIRRRDEGPADLTYVATPSGLAAVIYGEASYAEAGVAVHGDAALATAFQALFALPPKAARPVDHGTFTLA